MAAEEQWAWLGLLKWSLAYSDGTVDGAAAPMSAEDKSFLESVMKDGVINENDRMKTILKEVTRKMMNWKDGRARDDEEEVNEMLQELRDWVEQIDFARSFGAMKGLEFLLGCVQEREHIPESTRILCLSILSTMSSNNPPIQKQLLDIGAFKILSELFFSSSDADEANVSTKTIQAISSIVRSHELAETVFVQLEQSPALVISGLGMGKEEEYTTSTSPALRQRTLFLLRALATSDSDSTLQLVQHRFVSAILWVSDYMLDEEKETSPELREMALEMLQTILKEGKISSILMERKPGLVALGVRRVSTLRMLTTNEQREYAATELQLWEEIIVLLSRLDDVAVAVG